jgi:hypothetical protein
VGVQSLLDGVLGDELPEDDEALADDDSFDDPLPAELLDDEPPSDDELAAGAAVRDDEPRLSVL